MTEFTTIERIALNISASYDAIVRYKGFVCLATLTYKGTYDAEIYEYVDERIYYLEDVSEAKAHEICLHYFNGKPGKELHIYDIKDNTPCGDYWFDYRFHKAKEGICKD